MAAPEIACVLIKIHGIGNQPKNWSQEFDADLQTRLATLPAEDQARVVQESVWWADLSQLPMKSAAARAAVDPRQAEMADEIRDRYLVHLADEYVRRSVSGEPPALAPSPQRSAAGEFGSMVIGKFRNRFITLLDHANDVKNYVTMNTVRLAIQERLALSILSQSARHPQATIVVASHSQGTIIAYDILRVLGSRLGSLVWVTMGSPMQYYLDFLSWGREQLSLPAGATWLNYYDARDLVGTTVSGLVRWPSPKAHDFDVDNVGQGLHAHDHWRNPRVVDNYFELIQDVLAGRAVSPARARRSRRRKKAAS